MKTSLLIKFALRGVLALVASILIWEHTAAARVYHRGLATAVEWTARVFGNSVRDVTTQGDELAIAMDSVNTHGTLYITTTDITANVCVLVALFAAVPIRGWRRWGLHLAAALILLFITHVVAVQAIVSAAVGGPGTWVEGGIADTAAWMYPLAMFLWVPYLLSVRRRTVPGSSDQFTGCGSGNFQVPSRIGLRGRYKRTV